MRWASGEVARHGRSMSAQAPLELEQKEERGGAPQSLLKAFPSDLRTSHKAPPPKIYAPSSTFTCGPLGNGLPHPGGEGSIVQI